MKNPWASIDGKHLIATVDEPIKATLERKGCDFTEMPEPFLGDPHAPIYILLSNPLSSGEFTPEKLKNDGVEYFIKNYNHQSKNKDYPFFYLDKKFTGDKIFWEKSFSWLLNNDLGEDNKEIPVSDSESRRMNLAKKIFIVDLSGYKTLSDTIGWEDIPSRKYTIDLVERACKDERKIILMPRGRRKWLYYVPELSNSSNVHYVAINRGLEFSPYTIEPMILKKILEILR